MNAKVLLLMTACASPTAVMAQGCDVRTQSQSQSVSEIETHSCYEYKGVPAEAIGWSCSNESKGTLSTRKTPVERCAAGHVATCEARLTQEALANPHSTSKDRTGGSANIPDDAQVIWYYYGVEQLQQAKKDCETTGGRWQNR
ncbi:MULTISPECIES: hypothetical protein [unclassified Pseudomonas]|uniref:hypothetical protein n=1 Tax=unclassified Pseudomonas TaxID=196821 RepID=UPI000920D692|nr:MULTISPECIES: hypothetical protein [unclassified Pseudomonas]MDB6442394.1 hypothetical protein [Pseudomonas sp. 21TX0197]ROO34803.1 hypothetical protein BIV09_20785 [Pseudomonas sp. 7SR1]SFX60739.1 hypothetical protein SAMN03159442_02209 [Pseudomonas sp. NFACC47-1]SFY08776.1 hypothetical protein SAMN03159352_03055 [Pseudomonas sp. NFACC43]SFY15120.1 hypothetical protein SAMN03159390_03975 [Pseudomonas sp. NFACC49-2]